jgi:lysophospholipase L1-like esterase
VTPCKSRSWGMNILLILLSTAIFVLSFEIFLRVYANYFYDSNIGKRQKVPFFHWPRHLFRNDPYVSFWRTPNFEGIYCAQDVQTDNGCIIIKTNSHGLVDHEYSYEKPKDTFRLLLLGDSYTEAVQVQNDEKFAKILESRLNSTESRYKFEVINAGMSSFGTDQEWRFLKHYGIKYKPDMVILFFYINDFLDNLRPDFIVIDGWLVPPLPNTDSVHRKIEKFLIAHSYSFRFFLSRARILREEIKSRIRREESPREPGTSTIVYRREFKDTEYHHRAKRYLENIIALCKKNGIEFVLTYLPSKPQMRRFFSGNLLEKDYQTDNMDYLQPNRFLSGIARSSDIRFIDLLDKFCGGIFKNFDEIYYNGGHYTKKTHRVIAESIFSYLKDNNPQGVFGTDDSENKPS